MKKYISMILVLLLTSILISGCQQSKDPIKETKDKLSEYMQAIYAPKTMVEFDQSKAESKNTIFTNELAEKMFVKSSNELTDRDLRRSISTRIAYGQSEFQSDRIPRIIATAWIYESIDKDPIIQDFIFLMNEEGKLYDVYIERINY